MSRFPRHLIPAVLFALAFPSSAFADHGGGGPGGRNEVRAAGNCGRGATSKLKLKQDDGAIEVEFEVDHNRAGETWRVVIVRDGRVAWRGRARTSRPSGSFSVNRRISDLGGADRVTARATGPRGLTCAASALLPG
ncbi:MAG: hypothetical protein JWN32_1635 [Solirubrobacterales bacterium]|nr:hypothetical protein [Solirubrobacterales bacterium]